MGILAALIKDGIDESLKRLFKNFYSVALQMLSSFSHIFKSRKVEHKD